MSECLTKYVGILGSSSHAHTHGQTQNSHLEWTVVPQWSEKVRRLSGDSGLTNKKFEDTHHVVKMGLLYYHPALCGDSCLLKTELSTSEENCIMQIRPVSEVCGVFSYLHFL